jgi:hypothetical protein
MSQLSFGQDYHKALRLFIIGNSFSENTTAYLSILYHIFLIGRNGTFA